MANRLISLDARSVSAIRVALWEYAGQVKHEGLVDYATELEGYAEQLKWSWAYGEDD